MSSAYFDKSDLEDRMGANVVRAIFDDNNDGAADSKSINRFIADCSSEIDSFIRPIYPTWPLSPVPNQIKNLALDSAEWRLARREPEVVRKDWMNLRKILHEDLKNLRSGVTMLDIAAGAPPGPPANVGATVGLPSGSRDDAPDSQWSDFGDY